MKRPQLSLGPLNTPRNTTFDAWLESSLCNKESDSARNLVAGRKQQDLFLHYLINDEQYTIEEFLKYAATERFTGHSSHHPKPGGADGQNVKSIANLERGRKSILQRSHRERITRFCGSWRSSGCMSCCFLCGSLQIPSCRLSRSILIPLVFLPWLFPLRPSFFRPSS